MRNKWITTILCIILAFSLVGCRAPSPDSVVNNFLSDLQQGNLETAAQYLNNTTDDEFADNIADSEADDEEMQKALFSKIQHEIISSNIEGNTAKVETKITSLDLVKITTTVMSEIMPLALATVFDEDSDNDKLDELTEQYFNNAILDPEAPTITNTVTITLNKTDNSWLIEPNDELMNGVMGNIGILEDMFSDE